MFDVTVPAYLWRKRTKHVLISIGGPAWKGGGGVGERDSSIPQLKFCGQNAYNSGKELGENKKTIPIS